MKSSENLLILLIILHFCHHIQTQNNTNGQAAANNETIVMEDEVTIVCLKNTEVPPEVVSINDTNIGQKINLNKKVFFIIHGWTESTDRPWMNNTQHDLIKYYGYGSSACTVDWRRLAAHDILISETNAKLVGLYLAKFIRFLNGKGVNYAQINLIGHSLGAKVSSECGRELKGNLGSIYALDPAAVGLDMADAKYTQCAFCAFGNFRPMVGNCDTNFYFNGGVEQPACKEAPDFFCSHSICHDYFRYSVNPANKMYGYVCRFKFFGWCLFMDKDLFGVHSYRKFGILDAKTKDVPPYALGDIGASRVQIKRQTEIPNNMQKYFNATISKFEKDSKCDNDTIVA